MTTSEEKMREAFEGYLAKGGSEHFDIYANVETFAAGWQAALQESEAGAATEPYATFVRLGSCGGFRLVFHKEEPAENIDLYLAPPSAQAIETAAIMRAAGAVACPGRTIFDTEKAILALIPQDGRTKLEELMVETAVEVFVTADHDAPMFPQIEDAVDRIVTNLIGVPPLSSEGEKK